MLKMMDSGLMVCRMYIVIWLTRQQDLFLENKQLTVKSCNAQNDG